LPVADPFGAYPNPAKCLRRSLFMNCPPLCRNRGQRSSPLSTSPSTLCIAFSGIAFVAAPLHHLPWTPRHQRRDCSTFRRRRSRVPANASTV
jgi:hypothetical protein